jgi:hypothetical protein
VGQPGQAIAAGSVVFHHFETRIVAGFADAARPTLTLDFGSAIFHKAVIWLATQSLFRKQTRRKTSHG